jgi:hypothetical protein
MLVCSLLPTYWGSIVVPSLRIKYLKENAIVGRCMKTGDRSR